jgi:arginine/lysine/histidine/glutamine transport system substrate-binding/permease protein
MAENNTLGLPKQSLFANQDKARLNYFSLILESLPTLLIGVLLTLQLAFISVISSLAGGSLIRILSLSAIKPVRWLARAYVDFPRGTPLLVQIFMIYFGLPAFFQELGFSFLLNRLLAGVITFSLNSRAYIAGIVRAGIQSIEVGQSEAARSLGLNSLQTMRHLILPQALRRMIPPLGNEFISLLKDTSLVAVIGFAELFRKGQLIVAENYRAFEIYAAVAVIYLCLILVSSQAISRLEKWMKWRGV